MILCHPKGICSWDFHLSGNGHSADFDLNSMSEQGRMTIDGRYYGVTKHGFASSTWTLDQARASIYTAQKLNPFTRTFEITGGGGSFLLKAESAMGRSMSLEGNGVNCSIAPTHAFTRRATISGRWDDFRVVAFGFFLAVVTWRRAASSGAAAGG